MKIEFRKYDGKGNPRDPKTGTRMSMTLESFLALLRGKVITGAGGISADTEVITISFSDFSQIWFITTEGIPRLLFQDPIKL